jgi:hypothetical protein
MFLPLPFPGSLVADVLLTTEGKALFGADQANRANNENQIHGSVLSNILAAFVVPELWMIAS